MVPDDRAENLGDRLSATTAVRFERDIRSCYLQDDRSSDRLGSVVLVSNLDEAETTPDKLFTLFGVYGNVIRVKILFNKKDTALIQFAEATMAEKARQYLDK